MAAQRRQKGGYFAAEDGAPAPLAVSVQRRIHFSDVDPMGVLWHGRYTYLFEEGNEALGRLCELTYADFFRERVRAPIVQLHVDYFAPVMLAEVVTIRAQMPWTEGARINIEYEIRRQDGTLAATGYSVQMFIDEAGVPLVASPSVLEACRGRWRQGLLGGAT